MQLNYITEEGMELLQNELNQNINRYLYSEPYMDSFLKDRVPREGDWFFKHREYPNVTLDMIISSDSNDDVENAIRLYSQLRFLSPSDATDKRLWTYLTHKQGWEYMVSRWSLQRAIESAEKTYSNIRRKMSKEEFIHQRKRSLINERYFFDRVFLSRHGLARLWWAAHLTFDEQREDPFELLRVLFYTQDIAASILERNFSHNRKVLHAYLQYLQDTYIKKKKGIIRKELRDQVKNITFASNILLLDAMTEKDLKGVFVDC